MRQWISVKESLPERNVIVYAKNDSGIFQAVYLGPVIGWVNMETKSAAYVTDWIEVK